MLRQQGLIPATVSNQVASLGGVMNMHDMISGVRREPSLQSMIAPGAQLFASILAVGLLLLPAPVLSATFEVQTRFDIFSTVMGAMVDSRICRSTPW
jgi:hypothetical protein